MAKNIQKKKTGNGNTQQTSRSLARHNESASDIVKHQAQLLGNPFPFMRRFSEEMDRLFEDFGLGRGWLAPGFERSLDQLENLRTGAWAPQIEVLERDNKLIVRADLPGMTKDDIQVDLEDNSLIVRGERRSEREDDEEGYYRSERSYGSFYRRVPLPSGVNAEDASADFRDGVLEITMPAPKRSGAKRRQLDIGTGEARAKAKGAG
ncbi:MAG TPA: Hsp20/alpha crystallin family protein [Pyrinomonadaceae bacterium]|nr:Hsp20/alpha crystallin family protein [Pyrinomonadaceae bacterium]